MDTKRLKKMWIYIEIYTIDRWKGVFKSIKKAKLIFFINFALLLVAATDEKCS